MQTDKSRKLIHMLTLNLSGMHGEGRRLRQKEVRPPPQELCDSTRKKANRSAERRLHGALRHPLSDFQLPISSLTDCSQPLAG
jgi:hypothetical protein